MNQASNRLPKYIENSLNQLQQTYSSDPYKLYSLLRRYVFILSLWTSWDSCLHIILARQVKAPRTDVVFEHPYDNKKKRKCVKSKTSESNRMSYLINP